MVGASNKPARSPAHIRRITSDAVWGEFEQGLRELRDALATADRRRPLLDALREGVLALNALSPAEEP